MCPGTPEEFAAWRTEARDLFLDCLDGVIDQAAGHGGGACRGHAEAVSLYACSARRARSGR